MGFNIDFGTILQYVTREKWKVDAVRKCITMLDFKSTWTIKNAGAFIAHLIECHNKHAKGKVVTDVFAIIDGSKEVILR